ncbi:FxDxF family PEP-CTERM protein [Sphingomonas sp. BIUV-7]|uniref:FxDxF family PEP-CTERM protein n=1 Tax=Sphingomonas natans TaxID=3063330 RepID=A0ABT8YD70_9SPHN|nr:FxDxF family PEP-CTERM protein [Sphingomonas sp. BIUV-7]MDO6416269.1 FxDxF family PEP-CTERM protein [Sphingomonas sp. BIUV-7]
MGVRKAVLRAGAIAIGMLTLASAADATVFHVGDDNAAGMFKLTNGTGPFSPVITARFGADYSVGASVVNFADSFVFTIPQTGTGSGNVSTSFTVTSDMLTLTDILFNNVSYAFAIAPTSSGTSFTINNLPIYSLAENTLQIKGTATGINGYSGNLTFVAAQVPEPASWAMMVVGFGVIGGACRRVRKSNTAVTFA